MSILLTAASFSARTVRHPRCKQAQQRSWETYGVLPFLLPAPVVYLLATGAKGGGLAEANMRADDAIWIEKMRAKRAGKAVDD